MREFETASQRAVITMARDLRRIAEEGIRKALHDAGFGSAVIMACVAGNYLWAGSLASRLEKRAETIQSAPPTTKQERAPNGHYLRTKGRTGDIAKAEAGTKTREEVGT